MRLHQKKDAFKFSKLRNTLRNTLRITSYQPVSVATS